MFQLTALSSQLTFDITKANADGYIQALPDGEFAAVDGRLVM
jgi:phage I-like protein